MTDPFATLHVKNQKALFESRAKDFLCGWIRSLIGLVGYSKGFRPQTQSKLELDNFILWDSIVYCWRERSTSRCHDNTILGWQQTENSLKKYIRTVSNVIDLNQFHLICRMLVKFSGFNPKGSHLSLEKEKETFCVVFTYSIKRAREIRKIHVAVVQRRLRNVQKKRDARAK